MGWALALFGSAGLCAVPLLFRHEVRHWQPGGRLTRKVVLVGAGEHGRRLAEYLRRVADPSVRIVGVFDDRKDRAPARVAGHRVRGGLDDLTPRAACRDREENRCSCHSNRGPAVPAERVKRQAGDRQPACRAMRHQEERGHNCSYEPVAGFHRCTLRLAQKINADCHSSNHREIEVICQCKPVPGILAKDNTKEVMSPSVDDPKRVESGKYLRPRDRMGRPPMLAHASDPHSVTGLNDGRAGFLPRRRLSPEHLHDQLSSVGRPFRRHRRYPASAASATIITGSPAPINGAGPPRVYPLKWKGCSWTGQPQVV